MSIAEGILAELEHEAQVTRTALERVPDDKLDFRPHEKSMTLGTLAGHISEIPGWGTETITGEVFDMNPDEYSPPQIKKGRDALEKFNEGVTAFTGALKGKTDEELLKQWTMKVKGETKMQMPRVAVLRSFVLSHLIHHRAQLGVYFRLNSIPVPQTYGPTADEPDM